MKHPDDDRIPTPADKAAARVVLERPEHEPKANDPRDRATDDLDDPTKQEEPA